MNEHPRLEHTDSISSINIRYEEKLSQQLSLTNTISGILLNPYVMIVSVLMLLYHIFIYIYLGVIAGGVSFYNGFMYSMNYTGVLIAYWILWRQSRPLISWSHIISREMVDRFENKNLKFRQYELINENLKLLNIYKPGFNSFSKYCSKWESNALKILIVWNGGATGFILARIFGLWDKYLGKSFDDNILGLYGYYNLFGQYLSSMVIVTTAITMFAGYYHLRCLIISFAGKIREMRKIEETDNNKILKNYLYSRNNYLYLQKCCIVLGDLWSLPTVVSIFFCLQIVICNIFVIHNQLKQCYDNDCSVFVIFPFIWLLVGLYLMCMILQSVSVINEATDKIKNVFVYSNSGLEENKGDYISIGGRKNWIEYIESNPIQLQISGIVITKKYVINSITTLGIGLSSFIFSNIL